MADDRTVTERVSFVVPTRNTERTLAACLASIRAQDHPDVELVVVDNRSTDMTAAIARAHADVFESAGPERSAQRNLGADLASGSVVVFGDADMVFDPGVAAEAHALLVADHDGLERAGAIVVPELAFGDGFFARCRSLEKELYLEDPSVEAARAFRRADFIAVGGYDETLTGGEDWELADRLVAYAGPLARTTSFVWHDEGRIVLRNVFGKKRYYGHGVAAYLDDDHRRPLGRRALREPSRLVRRPHLSVGLALLKMVELSGIAYGVAEARSRRGRLSVTGGAR
jgi:glycosyltransferase involved in cell wall biosynthesis